MDFLHILIVQVVKLCQSNYRGLFTLQAEKSCTGRKALAFSLYEMVLAHERREYKRQKKEKGKARRLGV